MTGRAPRPDSSSHDLHYRAPSAAAAAAAPIEEVGGGERKGEASSSSSSLRLEKRRIAALHEPFSLPTPSLDDRSVGNQGPTRRSQQEEPPPAMQAPQPAAVAEPRATSAATRPEILIDARDGSKIEHVLLSREELEEGIERYGNSARRRFANDVAAKEESRGGNSRRDGQGSGARRGEDSSSGGGRPVIAGPFMARSEEDVFRVKKSLMDDLSSSNARRTTPRRWMNSRRSLLLAQHEEREEAQTKSARSTSADAEEDRGLGPYFRREAVEEESMEGMLEERQTQAENTCFVGNEVLSCYPTADTTVTQGRWSKVSSESFWFQCEACMLIFFASAVHLELQLPALQANRRSRRLPLPTRH
jgi:hypothetical protein